MTATGLFLGAGASFESGMPLVWDLTAEIKAWLTPEKLRELNTGWRAQGTGNPDAVISLVASLLNPSMHYENVLGNLEVQFKRPSNLRQAYYGLYGWLVELVYHLLGTSKNIPLWCDDRGSSSQRGRSFNPWPLIEAA